MATFEHIIAVVEEASLPRPRKGEGGRLKVTLSLPIRGNESLLLAIAEQRNNSVEVAITPLQLELPDEEPQPEPLETGRRRRRNGHTPEPEASREPTPDPADIPHEYLAPTSNPGGDCTVCGNGPNTDIHASELSPEAQSLIEASREPAE